MNRKSNNALMASKSHRGYQFDTSTYVEIKMDVKRDISSGRWVSKTKSLDPKKDK